MQWQSGEKLPEGNKAAVFAYTEKGRCLKDGLCRWLKNQGCLVADTEEESLDRLFYSCHLLVFIGACGIAVRKIAPFVKSKLRDPAVLVMDEKAEFVISLLSGHLGRANEWAGLVAAACNAQPVITTATDVNHVFSVDTWAAEHQLRIREPDMIRKISAAVLAGQRVSVYFEVPLPSEVFLPVELVRMNDKEAALQEPLLLWIGYQFEEGTSDQVCHLVPQDYVVGIGCRRGTSNDALNRFLMEEFQQNQLDMHRIGRITSIDVKKDEEGLQLLARDLGVPFTTFSAEELNGLKGDFKGSDFVRWQVGVDNVCERSACLGSHRGERILSKQSGSGMTLSVYRLRKE